MPHPERRSGAQATRSGTLVVVPAYNEEESLPTVLKELAEHAPECDVIVVDDGSTDRTAELARAAGALVAQLPYNVGVGGALRTGFLFAVRNGYERAAQVDADGQHDPLEIDRLLSAVDAGADMVIGSRFTSSGPSSLYEVGRVRGAAMRVLRLSVRLLSGRAVTDTSSGFRAFSRPMLEFFARNYPAEFLGDTVEALMLACHAGFQVAEVPVAMRERSGGRPSSRNVGLLYHYLRLLVTLASSASMRRRRSST